MSDKTITSHYFVWNFRIRLKRAEALKDLSDRERSFLIELRKRYRQYGPRMFLSDKQHAYLQMLAVRGGWRKSMDLTEAEYMEPSCTA